MNILRRYFPTALVIVAGCLLSVVSFNVVATTESERARIHFDRAASDRISGDGRSIQESIEAVDSVVAFFAAHGDTNKGAFDAFATSSLEHHNSIQAHEWIPRVFATDRAAYEAAAQRHGLVISISFGETQTTVRTNTTPNE